MRAPTRAVGAGTCFCLCGVVVCTRCGDICAFVWFGRLKRKHTLDVSVAAFVHSSRPTPRRDAVMAMFYSGQSYLGQFYLGQVLLRPILLRPILLRPILLRPGAT